MLRWGPVVAWMAGIFYFSSQSQPLGPVEEMPYSGLIGRLSHVGEYTVLALLIYRAFTARASKARALRPRGTRWRTVTIAFAATVAYAFTDELHQSLVPGRECSLHDLAYDAVGAAIGVAIGVLVSRTVGAQMGLGSKS